MTERPFELAWYNDQGQLRTPAIEEVVAASDGCT